MTFCLHYLRFISFLGLTFLPLMSFGQVFQGTILDAKKSDALPYANIGVRGKSIGGISDAAGHFKIDLSKAAGNDSVVISYIGYQDKIFIKNEITEKLYEVKLTPVAYQLDEVVAYAKRKVIVIGNKSNGNRYTGWGDYSSGKGRLRGAAIKSVSVPLRLSRFVMRLHDNTFDSVRIRIHILPLDPNSMLPTEDEILKENIFVTCKKDQKWVYVDLKPFNIVISKGIIVAAEWVDSWVSAKNTSGESYMLTLSLSNKDGYTYIRKTPEEPFTVLKSNNTPTMYFETFRVGNEE
jgi:hypothetical protein